MLTEGARVSPHVHELWPNASNQGLLLLALDDSQSTLQDVV